MQRNHIGHCRTCDYAVFLTPETDVPEARDWQHLGSGGVAYVKDYGLYARCPQSHKVFKLYPIRGTTSETHECDSRCLEAKGSHCVCACGGANHGRGHIWTAPVSPSPEGMSLSQRKLISALLDEREMSHESYETAKVRMDSLDRQKASAWIQRLLELPKKRVNLTT